MRMISADTEIQCYGDYFETGATNVFHFLTTNVAGIVAI